MMPEAPIIVWFRRDLRLADHPALIAASARNRPIIPVYIHSPEDEGAWPIGAASRWWLHQSLKSLKLSLKAQGLELILKSGDTIQTLETLIQETGAEALFFNRRVEPAARRLENALHRQLESLEIQSFHNDTLFEPGTILTQGQQQPYKVFTPFYNACRNAPEPLFPNSALPSLRPFAGKIASQPLDALGLMPTPPWYKTIATTWQPGEDSAQNQLEQFIQSALADYPFLRNRPDVSGTSRLSPYLHFGEISIRQVWWTIYRHPGTHDVFLRELIWREFARHILYFFPHTPQEPFDARFKRLKPSNSKSNKQLLQAWQKGQTGYPVIDAAMRELWATGWMHNRMRMVVASFLFKDLQLDWREGARWFWETLVDADLANNTLGWQWAAGCGVDAAPYFRIFNPVSQGEKFDPHGYYVRRWVPEIADLPDKFIHQPWHAPETTLNTAGITLGQTYPTPLVNHLDARQKALKLWEVIKS